MHLNTRVGQVRKQKDVKKKRERERYFITLIFPLPPATSCLLFNRLFSLFYLWYVRISAKIIFNTIIDLGTYK